ncbi:MAG: ABC transporter permease [Verrucomicrobiota bacterium]
MKKNRPKVKKHPWFAVRKDLEGRRRLFLTICSFLLPLAIWCFVSYTPFFWHPDIKLQISADRSNVTTVYTAGNHITRTADEPGGFDFSVFQQQIRDENAALREKLDAGEEVRGSRRNNIKLLRHIAPVGVANGWIDRDQTTDDAEIYAIWRGLALGELNPRRVQISDENLEVIKSNWAILGSHSETFDSKEIPSQPLLKLVPQGVPANPDYLPAPHEVVLKGFEDFTFVSEGDTPSMFERYLHSLKVVFLGFLMAALIGVPLGVLCGTFDLFSRLCEPFVDFFRYMPAPAFSTLLVVIFGAHDAPKVALVFVGTFFQLVLVVSNTTRQLDGALLEAAQTLGAKSLTLIRRVIIPGITPNLYNDLRILLGWAWTWLVIAELIGVKSGLTEFLETQGRFRNFDSVFPIIILIGVTGFVTDQILASLRKYFFPWTPEAAEKRHGFIGRFVIWLINRNTYRKPAS